MLELLSSVMVKMDAKSKMKYFDKVTEIEWFYELEYFLSCRKKSEPKKSKKKSKVKPKDKHRLKVK